MGQFTINPSKAQANLVDIQVDEVALVAKGHQPVHPDAIITLIKAEPETELEQRITTRILNNLRTAFGVEKPVEKAEEVEKASEPEVVASVTQEVPAVAETVVTSVATVGTEVEKSQAEALLALTSTVTTMQEQLSEFFKANAGAAVRSEAVGHSPAGTKEANQFVAAVKDTVDKGAVEDSLTSGDMSDAQGKMTSPPNKPHDYSPLVEVEIAVQTDDDEGPLVDDPKNPAYNASGDERGDAGELSVTKADVPVTDSPVVDSPIIEKFTKSLDSIGQVLESLQKGMESTNAQIVAIQIKQNEVNSTLSDEVRAQLSEALNKADAQLIDQARKNDIPPMQLSVPNVPAKISTPPNLTGMSPQEIMATLRKHSGAA